MPWSTIGRTSAGTRSALGGAVVGFVYEYVFQAPEVATGDSLGREHPAEA